MPSRETGHKMSLNNYCQRAGRQYNFHNTFHGSPNAGIWSSVVYVDNAEFGRGQAPTRLGAEEIAAAGALALINQGY